MTIRLMTSLSAALALAACAAPPPNGPVRTDTTASVAFQPGYKQIDLTRGVWGTQSLTPPAGLVMVRQGDLIGRTIDDASGSGALVIDYLLVDPATGDARYVVASGSAVNDYLTIPLSALRITPWSVSVDATRKQLGLMPTHSIASLETTYPVRTLTTTTVVPVAPTTTTIAPLPPAAAITAPLPPAATSAEPLQLARRGSVVGYPVVDSFGAPVGTIDAVAAVPTTGEVRYAIISGPSFGPGYYIAAPAGTTGVSNGRVVLAGSLSTWAQAPRYRSDQVQQTFGALGTID